MHSLPFLDDVNFVFVFVIASLSVDRVSDQFLQCTRSIRCSGETNIRTFEHSFGLSHSNIR